MLFRLSFTLLFALSAACIAPNRTAAQPLPPSLQVTRAFALTLDTAQLELTPEVQKQIEVRKTVRHARTMLVSGIPLILSGVMHAAIFGRKIAGCGANERLPLPPVLGAVVATAGVSLIFAGGFKLASVSREYRSQHPASAGKRVSMVVGALALFGVSQAVLFGASAKALLHCVTN